jgi:transposase
MLVSVKVHPANVQDNHGAFPVLQEAVRKHPSLTKFLADGGYQTPKISAALAEITNATLKIVKRPQAQKGFVPLPKRWIVERTFAWISRCRRLARDYECQIKSAIAFVKLAMIRIMLRRLTRNSKSN